MVDRQLKNQLHRNWILSLLNEETLQAVGVLCARVNECNNTERFCCLGDLFEQAIKLNIPVSRVEGSSDLSVPYEYKGSTEQYSLSLNFAEEWMCIPSKALALNTTYQNSSNDVVSVYISLANLNDNFCPKRILGVLAWSYVTTGLNTDHPLKKIILETALMNAADTDNDSEILAERLEEVLNIYVNQVKALIL